MDKEFEKLMIQMYGSIEEYEKQQQIQKAQDYLNNTDYVVIKMQEYAMLNKEVDNNYTDLLKKREECREILRKLRKE